jgi:RNA polymerase sigma-70 factor, ECF subfamily
MSVTPPPVERARLKQLCPHPPVLRFPVAEVETFPTADELVRRYSTRLWHYATALIGDAHRAEDIVQETLLIALKTRDRFVPEADLGCWLRGILRNVALRERRRVGPVVVDQCIAQAAELELDALHDSTEPGMEIEALQACMKRMDANGQQVIKMHYHEGLSCADISRAMERSLSWVKVTMHRLRAGLRNCIQARLNNAS